MLVYLVPADKRRRIEAAMAEAGGNYSTQPLLDRELRADKAKVVRILAQLDHDDAALVFRATRRRSRRCAPSWRRLMRVPSGDTDGDARVELLRDFEAGAIPVLGVSAKAGAVGLNCQRANVVVLADPSET